MLTKIYKNDISIIVLDIIMFNFLALYSMNNNMYISSVESANSVLSSLKSLARPLTVAEKAIGREAAMFLAKEHHARAIASAARLRNTLLQFYVKQGFTEDEAREQLRLDDFAHAEAIGLGTSKKCHWRNRQKMLRAMAAN